MLKKILIFSLSWILCAGFACAHPIITNETIRDAWGAPGGSWDLFPTGENNQSFCLANTIAADGGCKPVMGIYGDDQAIVGLVARKINAHGGYFCTMQLQCEGKSKAVTWYLFPGGGAGEESCFWLCENGYSGKDCAPINTNEYNLNTGNAACGTPNMSRERFAKRTVKTTGDKDGLTIEYSTEILHNRYTSNKEQDVMVGVAQWMTNKAGVMASPFSFYCTNKSKANKIGMNMYPLLASKTLCMPGYTGENCEKCMAANMCSGYTGYDETKHQLDTRDGCTIFTCKDVTTGFRSATERGTCVKCDTDGRFGVNDDGVCVQCSDNQIFDNESDTCKSATGLTTSDQRWGKDKISEPTDLNSACWTKTDPGKYKTCVVGN